MTMIAMYEMAKNGKFVKDGIKHFDNYSQFDADIWIIDLVGDWLGDDTELIKRSTRTDNIEYSEDQFEMRQELVAIWELQNGEQYELKIHATVQDEES